MSRGTKSCAVMDSMSSLHSAAEMQCRRDDERIPEHIVTEQVLVHNSDLPQKPSDFNRDPSPSSVTSSRISVQLTHFDSAEPVTAKLYQYRGERVAGFDVFGRQMICLPQLYEIFLKSLVGGLHTVYTKLKRLEIRPLICNVEQVRALRSLGAIQPGVNRCKLISCDDFERLYQDCHSSCSRPGRPAKRCPPNNEWGEVGKKEKLEDKSFEPVAREGEGETSAECGSCQQSRQTQLFLTLLPFTTQQLLVQNMMATAAAVASQQQQQQHEQRQQLEHHKQCVTQGMHNVIRQEESEISSLSYNSKSTSPPGGPLNLTKDRNSSMNESDSIDRTSSDRSINPSLTDQDSNSNQNTPTECEQTLQFALSKLIALIDVATTNFKAQRDAIDAEKTFAQKLQIELNTLRSNQQKMQRQLAQEQRKSRLYFRRFCQAKRESIDLRERLAQLDARMRRRSI